MMGRNGAEYSHGVSVRELDLDYADSRLYAAIVSQKMNSVPGFRTSAG